MPLVNIALYKYMIIALQMAYRNLSNVYYYCDKHILTNEQSVFDIVTYPW